MWTHSPPQFMLGRHPCVYPTERVSIAGNSVRVSPLLSSSFLSWFPLQEAGTVTLLLCLRYKFHCWLSPSLVWYSQGIIPGRYPWTVQILEWVGGLCESEKILPVLTYGIFGNSKEQCLIFLRNGSLFFPCLPDWCMEKEQRRQKCSVFNTGIILYWWKWLPDLIFIQCKDWWNFSAWTVWDRKMEQTQARNSHLWEPIADNSWQHSLSFLLGLVLEFRIYILLIWLYYYLFSRPLHMLASLKLKYSPCLGKGNVICENHSDTSLMWLPGACGC